MVKVFEDKFPIGHQGIKTPGMYMDGLLQQNLDILKKAVSNDWDGLIAVDGAEGSGKSCIAQQAAFYCDPTLTLDRIVFTPEQFREAVLKAEKYQAVIYDEGFAGLSSRKTMSDTNHVIVSMLTEVRQKNLFIFIVLPSFFDMDKYVALWRSRALLHVYADKFKRGFFRFYSYKKKKDLYVQGKKFYSYKVVKPDFSGRFTNFFPCGMDEYKKKKANSLTRFDPKREKLSMVEAKREAVKEIAKHMFYGQNKMKLTKKDIAELMGLTRQTIREYLKIEDSG